MPSELLDVNRDALNMLGLSRQQVIGWNLADIMPEARVDGRYQQYLEVIRSGKSIVIDEFPAPGVFGRGRWLPVRAFKLADGQTRGPGKRAVH